VSIYATSSAPQNEGIHLSFRTAHVTGKLCSYTHRMTQLRLPTTEFAVYFRDTHASDATPQDYVEGIGTRGNTKHSLSLDSNIHSSNEIRGLS
jgi:hypothetical protein